MQPLANFQTTLTQQFIRPFRKEKLLELSAGSSNSTTAGTSSTTNRTGSDDLSRSPALILPVARTIPFIQTVQKPTNGEKITTGELPLKDAKINSSVGDRSVLGSRAELEQTSRQVLAAPTIPTSEAPPAPPPQPPPPPGPAPIIVETGGSVANIETTIVDDRQNHPTSDLHLEFADAGKSSVEPATSSSVVESVPSPNFSDSGIFGLSDLKFGDDSYDEETRSVHDCFIGSGTPPSSPIHSGSDFLQSVSSKPAESIAVIDSTPTAPATTTTTTTSQSQQQPQPIEVESVKPQSRAISEVSSDDMAAAGTVHVDFEVGPIDTASGTNSTSGAINKVATAATPLASSTTSSTSIATASVSSSEPVKLAGKPILAPQIVVERPKEVPKPISTDDKALPEKETENQLFQNLPLADLLRGAMTFILNSQTINLCAGSAGSTKRTPIVEDKNWRPSSPMMKQNNMKLNVLETRLKDMKDAIIKVAEKCGRGDLLSFMKSLLDPSMVWMFVVPDYLESAPSPNRRCVLTTQLRPYSEMKLCILTEPSDSLVPTTPLFVERFYDDPLHRNRDLIISMHALNNFALYIHRKIRTAVQSVIKELQTPDQGGHSPDLSAVIPVNVIKKYNESRFQSDYSQFLAGLTRFSKIYAAFNDAN